MNNQRALLDKLMGSDRNMNEKQRQENRRNRRFKRWYDEKICPYWLCGLCPYTLFFNTKCDLGDCPLEHDDDAFYDFSTQKFNTRRLIERRSLKFYKELLDRVEWWIRQTQRKIELQDDFTEDDEEKADLRKKFLKEEISTQEDLIKHKEQMIEKLGEDGEIQKAQLMLLEVESIKERVQTLKDKRIDRGSPNVACQICGGQIYKDQRGKGQASREELHNEGRRHQGFLKIRQKIITMQRLHCREDDLIGSNSSRSRSYSRSRRSTWSSSSRSVSRSRSRSRRRRERSSSASISGKGD